MDGTQYAFLHFFHLDQANAAIHCAPVQFSPITFRLAEMLAPREEDTPFVDLVLDHKGRYEEDRGR